MRHALLFMMLSPALALAEDALKYPVTRKEDVSEMIHGVKIDDPYRWLEDDNASATQDWVKRQNEVTFGYLQDIPQREGIRKRMAQIFNFERFGVPSKQGNRYFFSRNDGLQNQSVWYTTPRLDAEPTVLLDPNKLSTDGTVAIGRLEPSEDGSKVLACASTAQPDVRKSLGASGKGGTAAAAQVIGKMIAEKAKAAGIEKVAFDRSGFAYHGRVKALADAAREAGLQF
jgi:prolyl oligopeptidase